MMCSGCLLMRMVMTATVRNLIDAGSSQQHSKQHQVFTTDHVNCE